MFFTNYRFFVFVGKSQSFRCVGFGENSNLKIGIIRHHLPVVQVMSQLFLPMVCLKPAVLWRKLWVFSGLG